jgi:hypothetical protein
MPFSRAGHLRAERGQCGERPSLLAGLNLLEPRLVKSHSTVIIPFDDCVIVVSLLNCAEFSSRLSEVAQTLDTISGSQFLAGGGGLGERWPRGTVLVRSRTGVDFVLSKKT